MAPRSSRSPVGVRDRPLGRRAADANTPALPRKIIGASMDFPFTSAIPRKRSVATRGPRHVRRHHETTGILGFVTHAHTCAVTRGVLNPLARGCPIWPDANCPRGHGCARVRASNTGTVPQALTATVVRAPEHRARTSRTKSPAPCIGGPRFRGFPLAEVGECPRSDRRPDLHNRYPGFALPPCLMHMRQVSSRPDTAPGGARIREDFAT